MNLFWIKLTINLNIIALVSLLFIKITIEQWKVSLQLPVKYPQYPAVLIGSTWNLIWRILSVWCGDSGDCTPPGFPLSVIG